MRKKYLFLLLFLFSLSIVGCCCYYCLFAVQLYPPNTTYIYIDRDDTTDSVYNKVKQQGKARFLYGLKWLMKSQGYTDSLHTGRYVLQPEDNVYKVFVRLYRGHQTPVNLTIGSVRTLNRLAKSLGKQLMLDSAEISTKLHDSLFWNKMGYTQQTLPCFFIPNTYQVYWDTNINKLIERFRKEYEHFWNKERLAQADSIGMTPVEVCTLASIVEEETNNNAEKPMIAGLYINRINHQIPLQADPTIKFALQDFGLRRISKSHLTIDSPYNTYRNLGLPPGPIRIPSPQSIDAVLHYVKHNYLYMCAKEDFSGTHNFAVTYSEHIQNARKYWKALNQRNIYK